MEMMQELSSILKTRLVDLRKAKEEGNKIVGYPPGGFLPEELVLAAGAIPICLGWGGDHAPVELSSAYICHWMDTFCRAQIGYATSGDDPYYSLVDLLAMPITDNHVRAISDVLDYNTDIEIFPFGVPHMKEKSTFDYYLSGLKRLRTRLEELTGNEITDFKLKQAISLCNRERELLRTISLRRKSDAVPIKGRDFLAVNHGSLLADKESMLTLLESLCSELSRWSSHPTNGARLLLTGSTLAIGDYRLVDILEEAGAIVVIEEFAEGLKPYWVDVTVDGDPMKALADGYFRRRVPPAWFRPAKETREFLLKLVTGFNVDGVIWYGLMYRESYETESYVFRDLLRRETGLPMLTVHSDYAPGETGQMRTLVETFIESLGGR